MLPAPRRLCALALVVSTAITVSACGARSELFFDRDEGAAGRPSGAGPGQPTTITAACAAFADAYCQKLLTCDALLHSFGTGSGSYAFRDQAQCRERLALACTDAAALPGAAGTAAQAQACAATLTGARCPALPELSPYAWTRVCDFSGGTLPAGTECRRDLQCASGRCSGSVDRCGVCEATLADGATCGLVDKGPRCLVGSTCSQGVCKRVPGRGEPCQPQGFACQDGFECVAGTCASPYGGDGCTHATCSAASGSTCDRQGDCVPLQIASSPGSCGNVSGPSTPNPSVCPAEHACVGQNDFGSGGCQPLARDGEACSPFGGPACLFPAVCAVGSDRCVSSPPCAVR